MSSKLKKDLQEIINNDAFKNEISGKEDFISEINMLLKKLSLLKRKHEILEKEHLKEITRARQLNHILCHDLLTPLAAMKSTLNVLESTPQEQRDTLMNILKRSLEKSLYTIDDVRNYLQVDEGKLELELGFFNADECVMEVIEVLSHKIKEKDIVMNITIEKDLDILIYRNSFINSVLVNILTNAIKFSKRGGEIKLDIYSDNETAVICVRDYGVGMSEKILANLFSVSEATSRQGTEGEIGTGFGMPIVKKFIESFDGDIVIESWEEKNHPNSPGTLVSIRLWKNLKEKIAI
ncbi:MAG: HAMP domain-containing histidine kinase [Bdellovibrionales bacterium]|nr:HAMP domain-containing histidine kinase [Bdellovibrionales bacterium]